MQESKYDHRIRTITAGVSLSSLDDISGIMEAITFLQKCKEVYEALGYEVQTTRIAIQNLFEITEGALDKKVLDQLISIDTICAENQSIIAIGNILPPDIYADNATSWIKELITHTATISFSTAISSEAIGIHYNGIRLASEICTCLSENSKGGEANFRYTASANCPAGVPFYPTAYHSGPRAFGIGLESANIVGRAFLNANWSDAKQKLNDELLKALRPIEKEAIAIAKKLNWEYNGIDTSTAPGLDASIGGAIESLTKVPFGDASTLSACALITDVLKNIDVIKCGYSGLMLPVIEDRVLAQRSIEKRFTVDELLLFSAVSGTGLDVIPIPGDTPPEVIARVYNDVAALSLKYDSKILSARLFPIPGKNAGDIVQFDNPFLTDSVVMSIA